MPSKYATTSNVRYDKNMRYDITSICVKASEGLSSLISLFVYVLGWSLDMLGACNGRAVRTSTGTALTKWMDAVCR